MKDPSRPARVLQSGIARPVMLSAAKHLPAAATLAGELMYRCHPEPIRFAQGKLREGSPGPARRTDLRAWHQQGVILSEAKDLLAPRNRSFAEFTLSEANGLRMTPIYHLHRRKGHSRSQQILRGVYPERSEWAQDDTGWQSGLMRLRAD